MTENYNFRYGTFADGKIIPAGANVFLLIFGTHHNPDIFPNPKIWNPENFQPDIQAQRPKGSFQPFGTGIRGCAGKCAKINTENTRVIKK